MKLVRLENYNIIAEDELLLLIPFKKLYKSDKTRDKKNFFDFLTIIYFVYDPRSDYSYIIDEEERIKEVCVSNGFEYPKFSDLEYLCIHLYLKLTTTSSLELLKSVREAMLAVLLELKATKETLNTLDGKDKINALNTLTKTVATIPNLIKLVLEVEKSVERELIEKGRARGGNDSKSLMDDGILI